MGKRSEYVPFKLRRARPTRTSGLVRELFKTSWRNRDGWIFRNVGDTVEAVCAALGKAVAIATAIPFVVMLVGFGFAFSFPATVWKLSCSICNGMIRRRNGKWFNRRRAMGYLRSGALQKNPAPRA